MKVCELCGAEFVPIQKRSKYCSRKCSVKAYSLSRSQGEMKTCAWCGKKFYAKYKHKKYCSDLCSQSAYNEKQREYARQRAKERSTKIKPERTDLEPIKCLHCGKEFIPSSGNQIYCSPECRVLFHRKINQPASKEKTCAICGKVFTPTFPNQKYCSKTCGSKVVYDNHSKKIEDVKEEKPKKKISPAKKRYLKMSLKDLTIELDYYGIRYRDVQQMADNDNFPEDFGLKRKRKARCK